MSTLRNRVKTGFEHLLGNRIWVEHASNIDDVRSLIRSLAPVAIEQPLVRIGGAGDGGYLLPDDLTGLGAAISPGVANEVGFDFAIAERQIPVVMADASVAEPSVQHPRFHFIQKKRQRL